VTSAAAQEPTATGQALDGAGPAAGRDAGPVIGRGELRAVFGRFATGITVVTTVADGVPHAMTANSFSSVSLDPPLVLVCVERSTRLHDAVLEAGVWGVSILSESARAASEWFAFKGRPLPGQFDTVDHRTGPATGVPLLTAAVATLECRTWAVYDGGDHTIVVGRVLDAVVAPPESDGEEHPLLYWHGRYHRVGDQPPVE
jgi:flavin reductase (DIM6/NTAB) family NADH-FMN oxidoreductase RutF